MSTHTMPGELSSTASAPVRYRRVRVFGRAIRSMHWIAVLCILTLVATGMYIADPYFTTDGEASRHFLMGDIRFAHFTAAGVLVAMAIVRVYKLFVGNRFENWHALVPDVERDAKNMWLVVKKYLLIQPRKAPHYLGRNPLEQAVYLAMYLIAIVQILTGFYLYGLSDPGGFFFTTFGWVGSVFGGTPIVRFWHYILMWPWLVFIPVHIYMVVRADVLDQEGRVSSMVSGGRYARSDVEYIDD